MKEHFQLGDRDAAAHYESNNIVFMRPMVQALIDACSLAPTMSLLDVACGTGFVGRAAHAVHPELRVTGCDVNESMLSVARAAAPDSAFFTGSASSMPFDDNAFDVVTCQQGFQFFPDTRMAAKEFRRVVKGDGRVVATTWQSLDNNPYFAAQAEALSAHIDPQAANGVSAAVWSDGDERFSEAFASASFDVKVSEVRIEVQLPDSLSEYVRNQLQGTPWFGAFNSADEGAQNAYVDTMVKLLDGMHTNVPFTSWMAVATPKSSANA